MRETKNNLHSVVDGSVPNVAVQLRRASALHKHSMVGWSMERWSGAWRDVVRLGLVGNGGG